MKCPAKQRAPEMSRIRLKGIKKPKRGVRPTPSEPSPQPS